VGYDAQDAARDVMYEEISRELYQDYKAQAISEFTASRLQSYYKDHSWVMRPAVEAIQEGRRLQANKHSGAAVVFFGSAVELLLKATLLKPVVHGLVHSEGLAEIIVEQALGQSGFDRYAKLLAKLFNQLAGLDIAAIAREEGSPPLLTECATLQAIRNKIIHRGESATADQAESARLIAVAVYEMVVVPMIACLGLRVAAKGEITV
jgi:hypothetical protein